MKSCNMIERTLDIITAVPCYRFHNIVRGSIHGICDGSHLVQRLNFHWLLHKFQRDASAQPGKCCNHPVGENIFLAKKVPVNYHAYKLGGGACRNLDIYGST